MYENCFFVKQNTAYEMRISDLISDVCSADLPFGTFYTPNITPDPETGIGAWSEADLAEALRHGTAPDGDAYYPDFPYPSYTGMTDADIGDLYVYRSEEHTDELQSLMRISNDVFC